MRSSVTAIFLLTLSLELTAQISLTDEFWYPDEAIENGIQGKVYIQFTAIPTGEILDSTVQVAKGLGYGLDELAMKAVKDALLLGRNYITQLKKDEPTKYVIPIVFTIMPKHWAMYYFKKGMKEHELGNFEQPIQFFNQSVSFIDDEPKYYYSLYSSLKELGNSEEACAKLKKAKQLDKRYYEQWEAECK